MIAYGAWLAKLEKLHQKMIAANAKYDPADEDDFPTEKTLFKKKFGLTRLGFWKMKAYEAKLSVTTSPGVMS